MKRFFIIFLVVVTIMVMPLFAVDQILVAGMYVDASDLRDISTPSELDFLLTPYVNYEFGRPSSDNLNLVGYINAPYLIGEEITTIWPSVGATLNYRIHSGEEAIMQTGLSLFSNQNTIEGTYADVIGHFYWYPYNRATEVTVSQHIGDLIDGLRLGIGLDAGAQVTNLLEAAPIETTLHGGLIGSIAAGSQLSSSVWFQSNLKLQVPAFNTSTSFDSYALQATSVLDTSFGYYGQRLIVRTGVIGSLIASNLLTQNGFLDGGGYTYNFLAYGELSFFVIENLNVYGGAEFAGVRGVSDDSAAAYIGIEYFIL